MREEAGAEGEVSETISWMARRSLSRCSGLLMPISRWISVSDKLAMMAPLLTLARQAATYHAGMPTHSWTRKGGEKETQRQRRPPRDGRETERKGETETERRGKASWGETERHRKFPVRRNRQRESKRHESHRETEEESQRKVMQSQKGQGETEMRRDTQR